jgi:ubiquinone/menaquinone biosynthesis C-methylase UbiE
MNDKDSDRIRYESASKNRLNYLNDVSHLKILGSDNFEQYHRPPFLIYENFIIDSLKEITDAKILDLCCGDGVHSFTGVRCGASVIALDYSQASIEIAKMRAEILEENIDFRCSDVEKLSFNDSTFDIITCAGSLSYLDQMIFFKEVKRVLKSDGKFIVIDSFNHNLIYRLNRFFHFIRGKRSYSTIKRMPSKKVLKNVMKEFPELNVKYFGIFIFLTPILRLFFPSTKIAGIITSLDQRFPFLRKYSFKIIFIATKK